MIYPKPYSIYFRGENACILVKGCLSGKNLQALRIRLLRDTRRLFAKPMCGKCVGGCGGFMPFSEDC